MMQKGFNSDISVKGREYHVQTEDWGMANPYLVSRIFANGAVVKTIKTSYEQAIGTENRTATEAIRLALKKQHYDILDKLFSGEIG